MSVVPAIIISDFDQQNSGQTNAVESRKPERKKCKGNLLYRGSTKVVGGIEFLCGKWGELVATYPWIAIVISVILASACGIGLISLKLELRPYKLWIKEPSEFKDVLEWKMENFPTNIRKHIGIWEMPNILTADAVRKMWELHKRAEAIITAKTKVSYSDVCLKIPSLLSPDDYDYSYDYGDEEQEEDVPLPAWLSPVAKRSTDVEYSDDYDYPDNNDTLASGSAVAAGSLPAWLGVPISSTATTELPPPETYIDSLEASRTERMEHCEYVDQLDMICYEESLLEVWGYNETLIYGLTDERVLKDINSAMNSRVTGFPMNVSSYLGEIQRNDRGEIIGASGCLQVWYTNVDMEQIRSTPIADVIIDVGSGEQVDNKSFEWEQHLSSMVDLLKVEGMPINLQASFLFGSVHRQALFQDFFWVIAGWGMMLVYVLITLGKPCNRKKRRIWPACVGVCCVLLSVIASYGLCNVFGIPYGPLNSVLPVLLIALGVDDMYVILNAWDTVQDNFPVLDIQTRTKKTLEKAGLAITVTSLTDVIAFIVGATTEVPALRYFCVYAAAGITFGYILQNTLFVAAMVLHQKRLDSKKACLPSCSNSPNDKLQEIKKTPSRSFSYMWGKFLLHPIVVTLVLVVTGATIGASLCQVFKLQQRFESMWLLPRSSDIYKWFSTMDEIFPKDGREGSVYFQGVQLPEELPELQLLSRQLSNLPSVSRVDAWYDKLAIFIENEAMFNSSDLTRDSFMDALSYFLFSEQGAQYQNDFIFPSDTKLTCKDPASDFSVFKIKFQYFRLEHDRERSQQAMKDVRRVVAESNITGYKAPWALSYGQWETDEVISIELLRNILVVLLIVFIMTMILLASLRGAILVVACVLATLIDVAALMHLWGLTINTVSCISLIIAVGICVDYAAHITHGFLVTQGTNQHRAKVALSHMGPAVLHGGCSTLLAFVFLSPSDTYVFTSYFKILTGVAVFGLYHALVLLPILLSLVGPLPYPDNSSEDSHSCTTESTQYPYTPNSMSPAQTPQSTTPNSPTSLRLGADETSASDTTQITHVDFVTSCRESPVRDAECQTIPENGMLGTQALRNIGLVRSKSSLPKQDKKEDKLGSQTVFISNTIPIKDNENTVKIYVKNT